MASEIQDILDALREATSFEDAAQALLERLVPPVRAAMERHPETRRGQVLRAVLHLRPDDGYRAYVVLPTRPAEQPGEAPPHSATAWTHVRDLQLPVALDVEARTFSTVEGRELPHPDGLGAWAGPSRVMLRQRATTHLLALPLRSARRQVVGMVSVEVSCPRAVGLPFVPWRRCAESLQLLADVAGPYLVDLPSRPDRAAYVDRWLPVIGRSMEPVIHTLATFAAFDETLLLRGPTGSGKSHLARWVHDRSARREGPFVVAELHAVAETMREAELFGWVRGAFTGAHCDHQGWVARAEGGTLFIDEIDKLDLAAQGKLLRLIEERRYSVLGEARDRLADVRFIVGTNADLEAAVEAGTFLRDLYYRVNVLPTVLPGLDERVDELGPWARHFAAELHAGRRGTGTVHVTDEAVEQLAAHRWPGNLRQLRSVVTRAYAFASAAARTGEPTIDAAHVRRSLEMDIRPARHGIAAAMGAAADAFVAEAVRRAEAGEPPLDLDLAEAFKGFVLSAARARTGSLREAFVLFGLGHRIRGGNHLKTWRREQERVRALCAAFGVPDASEPEDDGR